LDASHVSLQKVSQPAAQEAGEIVRNETPLKPYLNFSFLIACIHSDKNSNITIGFIQNQFEYESSTVWKYIKCT